MTKIRKAPPKKAAVKKPAPKKAAPAKKAAPRKPAVKKSDEPSVDDLYKAVQGLPNGDKVKKEDLPTNVTGADVITGMNDLLATFTRHPLGSPEWKKDFRAAYDGPMKRIFGEKVLNTLFPDAFAPKQPNMPIEIVECSFKNLPIHILAKLRMSVDDELQRRADAGKQREEIKEDAGSSTNFKNVEMKLPVMNSELLSLDSHVNVLYGSLQRLNRVVTRASGETLDLPPSMADLTEKEKPENMLAAAKLLNHKLNLINQSVNEHLNQLDHVI